MRRKFLTILSIAVLGFALNQGCANATVIETSKSYGCPLGLVSTAGKIILEPRYAKISYLVDGIYLAHEFGDDFSVGENCTLFNRDGKPLAVAVPGGTTFAGLYHAGTISKAENVSSLPPDAILIFKRGEQFGLCSTSGEIILDSKYGFIDSVNGGRGLVFEKSVVLAHPGRHPGFLRDQDDVSKTFYFDVSSKKLIELKQTGITLIAPEYKDGMRAFSCASSNNQFGYLDATGAVAIAPKFTCYEDFSHGQALVMSDKFKGRRYNQSIVVDKKGNCISPVSFDAEERWNNAYIVSGDTSGIVNEQFKFVYGPTDGPIAPLFDGNFDNSAGGGADCISNTGKILKSDLPSRRVPLNVLYRIVPKTSQNNVSIDSYLAWTEIFCEPRGLKSTDRGGIAMGIGASGMMPVEPIDRKTEVAVKPFVGLAKPETDRCIVVGNADAGPVSVNVWRKDSRALCSKIVMFARILRKHNLFDMSRQDVLSLFGSNSTGSDTETIELVSAVRNSPPLQLRFTFSDEKLKSWQLLQGAVATEQVLENAVFAPEELPR